MTITIKPAEATIHYAAELHSPFHHGAGSSGNTALLRRQEVVQPDGTVARVPFLSAASIRHALRDRIAWHLADTIQIERRSLPKGAVDLMWTGGAVTTTGAETDLDMIRRIEDLLPPVSLFGYAARSDIVEGKLRASDLILACRENAWRIHSGLIPDHALGKRAAAFTSDEFGTRHDIATSPAGQFVDDITAAFGVTSTQMIFETQVLKAGSWLSGSLYLTAGASEAETRIRRILDCTVDQVVVERRVLPVHLLDVAEVALLVAVPRMQNDERHVTRARLPETLGEMGERIRVPARHYQLPLPQSEWLPWQLLWQCEWHVPIGFSDDGT